MRGWGAEWVTRNRYEVPPTLTAEDVAQPREKCHDLHKAVGTRRRDQKAKPAKGRSCPPRKKKRVNLQKR